MTTILNVLGVRAEPNQSDEFAGATHWIVTSSSSETYITDIATKIPWAWRPIDSSMPMMVEEEITSLMPLLDVDEVAPPPMARTACRSHLTAILAYDLAVTAPRAGLPGDGTILLEWRRGPRSLFAMVYPNGLIRQYATDLAHKRPEDGAGIENPTPRETLDAITWVREAPAH